MAGIYIIENCEHCPYIGASPITKAPVCRLVPGELTQYRKPSNDKLPGFCPQMGKKLTVFWRRPKETDEKMLEDALKPVYKKNR